MRHKKTEHGGARTGAGRPRTGREIVKTISLSLPPKKIARLDEIALEWNISRSAAIARLIPD